MGRLGCLVTNCDKTEHVWAFDCRCRSFAIAINTAGLAHKAPLVWDNWKILLWGILNQIWRGTLQHEIADWCQVQFTYIPFHKFTISFGKYFRLWGYLLMSIGWQPGFETCFVIFPSFKNWIFKRWKSSPCVGRQLDCPLRTGKPPQQVWNWSKYQKNYFSIKRFIKWWVSSILIRWNCFSRWKV